MSDIKSDVSNSYSIGGDPETGKRGEHVRIRFYFDNPKVDLEINGGTLTMTNGEALMIAQGLMNAAMPTEEAFWPDDF